MIEHHDQRNPTGRHQQATSALVPVAPPGLVSALIALSLGRLVVIRLPRRAEGPPRQWGAGLVWLLLLGLDATAADQAPAAAATDGSIAPTTAVASATSGPPGLPSEVPVGAIIAFMPRPGSGYGNQGGLRRWLDDQGWAICDGTRGTPDLRHRLLLGTAEPAQVGRRLGSRDHDHRIRGESGTPVRRNRSTPTGRLQLRQIPDDQHRHGLDLTSAKAEHLPPSLQVLFIMKLR